MADAKLAKYGFYHDKAQANSALGVSDCGNDVFFIQFESAQTNNVIIDQVIDGHTYSIVGVPGNTKTKFYWCLGASKDKTQVNFVDKKPVAEATEAWPTITGDAKEIKFSVESFTGAYDTYPTQLTQINGVDGKPVKDLSLSVSTSTNAPTDIQKEESPMSDPAKNLAGCNFDQTTADAIHGRKIVMLVTDKTGAELLAIGGQQSATWTVESESAESTTKDGTGEWLTRTPGQKSWTASNEGLLILDDEARQTLIKAMKNGEFVCVGLYERQVEGKTITMIPVRKGLAIVQSDELEAPSDDNATVSSSFDGTGECWMREAAEPDEVEAATVTITED